MKLLGIIVYLLISILYLLVFKYFFKYRKAFVEDLKHIFINTEWEQDYED